MAPLSALSSSKITLSTFKWTQEAENSFVKLKEALTTAPVLLVPNYDKIFYIHCDASSVGIGAALVQTDDDNQEHPIAYYSRTLNKAERNYCMTERELHAVVEAVAQFRHYV